MLETADPELAKSFAQVIVGALFGSGGLAGWLRLRANRRTTQEQRCEHICANMVAAFETMLEVMEVLGTTHPGMTKSIINARIKIDEAKRYLDGSDP